MTQRESTVAIVAAILLAADRVCEYVAVSGARVRSDFDYDWRPMSLESALDEANEIADESGPPVAGDPT